MYGLTALNAENYPPIDEQIEKFDILLPSKAYPVISPIFNTFYVNGIYLMILLTIERYYAICHCKSLSSKFKEDQRVYGFHICHEWFIQYAYRPRDQVENCAFQIWQLFDSLQN